MELVKRNIHMNRRKSKAVSQLTLDDDYNVPDSKLDVNRIIQKKGSIKVEDVQVTADHVMVSGYLEVKILYISDTENKMIHSLEGRVPFEENINLDGVVSGDNIKLKWDIEDLTTNLINSRKLSNKAIVTFTVSVEELYDAQTAVELADMQDVSIKNKGIDTMQMTVNKKDTLRIKEEVNLPSNKPNIHELLWDNIQLRAVEIMLDEDKIKVKGEIFVFVLYAGDDDKSTTQWIESAIPFNGVIELQGCRSDLISNIEINIIHTDLDVRPDYDGEERVIQVEAVLELDIKLYNEEHIDILQDVYVSTKDLVPIKEDEVYESLLVKNFSKCRTNDRIPVDSSLAKMLQICHSEGEVKVDEVSIVENGIDVEGFVNVQILYITSDDTMPFYALSGLIPFHHVIEAPKIDSNCVYHLQTDLEQLSTTMIDSDEIEVKVTINLNAMVVRRLSEKVIVDIEENELDREKLEEMPGMIGYIVQIGDTLWDIAKQFYTTIDQIRSLNDLSGDEVMSGDRLIIMKTVAGA